MTPSLDSDGTPTDKISDRVERTGAGRLQIMALLVVGFGSLFELLELTMTGIFGAVFAGDVLNGTMSPRHLGLLLAATSIGAAIGSPLLGLIADRVGRRVALITALVWAAAFFVAGGFSPTPNSLLATRMLGSLGIGAYLPIAAAYITDIIPTRLRGRALMLNVFVGGFGGLLGGVLTRWFTGIAPFGLDGWRCTMLAGAAGMLICAFAALFLPESPYWLEAKGRRDRAIHELERLERSIRTRLARPPEADAVTVTESQRIDRITDDASSSYSVWNGVYLGRGALISALQFALPWCTASFVAFIGWVFSARGYSLSDTFLLQGLLTTGSAFGAILAMTFVDRVSRPSMLIVGGVVIGISALVFTGTRWLPVAIAAGFTITMAGAVQTWILMLYSAELFPPLLRGQATSIAYAVNRGSSIAVPLVILPLLMGIGEIGMFSVMAAAMFLSSAILVVSNMRSGRKPQPGLIGASSSENL